MRGETRNKVVALAILAIIGIAMGFVYTAIVGRPEELNTMLEYGSGVIYFPNGTTVSREWVCELEVVGHAEDGSPILGCVEGTMRILNMTVIHGKQSEWLTADEEARALEIALNDPRVREIIDGKEYKIFGIEAIAELTESGERRKAGVTMTILIPEEEAMYAVFISLEREEVTCIIRLSEPKPPE